MFDRRKLFKNIEKNLENIADSEFFNFVKADMLERLELLDKKCERILIIRDHEDYIASRISDKFAPSQVIALEDEEKIHECEGQYDMIVFPFGLQWTNKVQEFLQECANKLKHNGLLMCNFCGGGTLSGLRRLFYNLEDAANLPHAPHIAPMIKFDQVASLLQQAGFAENIVDMEKFDLEFDSPLALIKAIKNTAQSNILSQSPGYSITKKMYQKLSEPIVSKFIDNVNLITFLSAKEKNSIKLEKNPTL